MLLDGSCIGIHNETDWRVVGLLFFDKKRIRVELGLALACMGGVIEESFNPDIIQTRPSVAGSGSSNSICGAVTFKISVAINQQRRERMTFRR